MCGIFCLISPDNPETLSAEFEQFEELIQKRGPNFSKTEIYKSEKGNILFFASVLWLQGAELTPQPVNTEKSIFLYNGDLFNSDKSESDTTSLFKLLEDSNDLVRDLSTIEGPYAFVFFNKLTNKLYFMRDPFGRRSLLIGKNTNKFIITSVARRNTNFGFLEVPCCGIFCLDLSTFNWSLFPWKRKYHSLKIPELESFLEQSIHIHSIETIDPISFKSPPELFLDKLNYIISLPYENILDYLLRDDFYSSNVLKLKQLLFNSVKKRLESQPKFCQVCFQNYTCKHAISGILFSGGVDCAILAFLTDKFIDKERPIDLINVSFEKGGSFAAPDRITGKQTLEELRILCPGRKWNFVEINVEKCELDFYRRRVVSHLIYPLSSVLDDSLGCALWFASRAKTDSYTSPCRTIMVGMGADELFGGYTRHRAALEKRSWLGLHDSLTEDWFNLPHRNLGRDDRVVSDHGRQLRTPYLDEQLVKFVQNLNCWERTIPIKNLQGLGEKVLLRCLAHDLGLKKAAVLKKRALQFGSRIANSKEKGHEISERL